MYWDYIAPVLLASTLSFKAVATALWTTELQQPHAYWNKALLLQLHSDIIKCRRIRMAAHGPCTDSRRTRSNATQFGSNLR